jgi:hypothetical protein
MREDDRNIARRDRDTIGTGQQIEKAFGERRAIQRWKLDDSCLDQEIGQGADAHVQPICRIADSRIAPRPPLRKSAGDLSINSGNQCGFPSTPESEAIAGFRYPLTRHATSDRGRAPRDVDLPPAVLEPECAFA